MTLHGFESHSDRVSRSSRNRERRKRDIYIYTRDILRSCSYIYFYIYFLSLKSAAGSTLSERFSREIDRGESRGIFVPSEH